MSERFFDELELPPPDAHLGVGSGTHAVQTARVMAGFDDELERHPADAVVVVGDVNSTLACALVAAKTERRRLRTSRRGFEAATDACPRRSTVS